MARTTPLAAILILWATVVSGQVCDLEELDTITTPGTPTHSVVVSSVAYAVAGSAGIVHVNTVTPRNLSVIGTTPTQGEALDIAYEYFGNELVVAEGDAGIGTYDVLADGSLSHLGTVDLGARIISISGSAGDYVAGSQEGTLYLVTLDADEQPVVEGQLSVPGQVVDLLEHSRTAYCALGSSAALAVVDIHDRSAPSLTDVYNLPGAARSIARSGDLILVGVEGVGIVVFQLVPDGLTEVNTLELDAVPTDLVVWNERVFMAGPQLGLVEADPSLGTDLVQIGELPLPGATAISLVGDTVLVGRGASGFSAIDTSDCANPDSAMISWYIPAGARTAGASGSFWLTDIAVTNFSIGVATVNVAYLPKNQDNTYPLNASFALSPGEQVLLGDVFFNLLGRETANGSLRVTASHPDVKITSRTYNAAGQEGTYGQFIPALRDAASATTDHAGGLIQLQENADFRTNIGLVNPDDTSVEVEIHLYDAEGTRLGTISRTLQPFEMTQYDRIYNRVDAGVVDSGFAVVRVLTPGGLVLSYASVVDNGSNDPIYVPAQQLSDASPFNQ
jgi:hypothetical protein